VLEFTGGEHTGRTAARDHPSGTRSLSCTGRKDDVTCLDRVPPMGAGDVQFAVLAPRGDHRPGQNCRAGIGGFVDETSGVVRSGEEAALVPGAVSETIGVAGHTPLPAPPPQDPDTCGARVRPLG